MDTYAELFNEPSIDENDLDDPELLQQLEILSSGVPKKQAPKKQVPEKELANKQVPKKESLTMEDYTDLMDDKNIDVDLDEADLQDPHLLGELSKLSGNDTEDTPPPLLTQQEAQQQAAHYQQLALAAKKQGDKQMALDYLRQSKAISREYSESIQTSEPIPAAVEEEARHSIHSKAKREPTLPPPAAATATVTMSTSISTPPPPPTPVSLEKAQKLLALVAKRQKEYKQAAIHYKTLGNSSAAKEMIQHSKELLRLGVQINQGRISDFDTVERSILPAPPMDLGRGPISIPSSYPNVALHSPESQLNDQIAICHRLSLQHTAHTAYVGYSKSLKENNVYDQLEKALVADRLLMTSQDTLPSFHYEQVEYTYTHTIDSIPANQMELRIIKASGLPTLDIATVLEPYVTYDFGGWPPENSPQSALGKGETGVKRDTEPVFDVAVPVPISRTSRVFLRYLQRKKLVLEVWHNKYSLGVFRRPVSLGKVTLPLDRLLTKTSLQGDFDILDSGRKKTGGKLSIALSVREPLAGSDTVKKTEPWLVVDGTGDFTLNLLVSTGLVPAHRRTTAIAVSHSSPPPSPLSEQTQAQAQAQAQAQVQTQTQTQTQASPFLNNTSHTPNTVLEEAEEEHNSVDSLVSNMVLEHEIKCVEAALAKHSNESLIERQQALAIKMNMLVIQVQTGMLDMETYLASVQTRMERDRQLAVIFKQHGKLGLAKEALLRKKMMQQELEEAREAMES
ncbi:hypothetical protein BDF14DRAFT_1826434 [Spinellus fusiger]|nr:hypothetical protein BDF14DRAFT_1826434 [Spinellus fusiger]